MVISKIMFYQFRMAMTTAIKLSCRFQRLGCGGNRGLVRRAGNHHPTAESVFLR